MKFLLIVVIALIAQTQADNHISCEEIDSEFEHGDFGKLKSCEMTDKTEIEVTGATLATEQDDSMDAIRFYANKKIFFLPVDVHKNFPKLKLYFAHNCNIRTLYADNFAHLSEVKELHLDSNRIHGVDGEMFKDMTSLEVLYLSKMIK